MVASSTICFNRLDNIMYSLEASHFKFPGKRLVWSRLYKTGTNRKWMKSGSARMSAVCHVLALCPERINKIIPCKTSGST